MRKFFFIPITVILVLILFGCDAPSVYNEKSVAFYYTHNEIEFGTSSGVITSTVVNVNSEQVNYEALLKMYFNGPTNYDCISPFAAGTTMEEFIIDGNKASILLSPHMATLRDSTMTVALACLTRTVVEMTGVATVHVRIQNGTIWGKDSVTLSMNSFNYFDNITP